MQRLLGYRALRQAFRVLEGSAAAARQLPLCQHQHQHAIAAAASPTSRFQNVRAATALFSTASGGSGDEDADQQLSAASDAASDAGAAGLDDSPAAADKVDDAATTAATAEKGDSEESGGPPKMTEEERLKRLREIDEEDLDGEDYEAALQELDGGGGSRYYPDGTPKGLLDYMFHLEGLSDDELDEDELAADPFDMDYLQQLKEEGIFDVEEELDEEEQTLLAQAMKAMSEQGGQHRQSKDKARQLKEGEEEGEGSRRWELTEEEVKVMEQALDDEDIKLLDDVQSRAEGEVGDEDDADEAGDEIWGELREDPFAREYPETVNLAGPGEPGWHYVDTDEDNGITWWAVDFTGGAIPEIEKNALLSNDAKNLMYEFHTQDGLSVEEIAKFFKVRQQRVMAILALKELEAKAVQDGEELEEELADWMENEVWDCVEDEGTGERHVKNLPQQPRFEYADIPKGSGLKPGDLVSEVGQVEEELARREEQLLVQEFRDRIDWNMGRVGKSISRASRTKHAPKRPPEGWSLVINPIGGGQQPYVAQPDGSKRELTIDEQLYLDRQKPKPRRRIR